MLHKIPPPKSRSHAQPRLLWCQFPIRRYCTFSSAFSSTIRFFSLLFLPFPFLFFLFPFLSFPSLSFLNSFPFFPSLFLSHPFFHFSSLSFPLSIYTIYVLYLCIRSMLSIFGVSTFLFARRVGLRRPGRDDSMAGLRPGFLLYI